MARTMLLVVGLCATVASASDGEAGSEVSKNPIRKVVSLLQNMKNGVEEEGKKEQSLFDKFMCYCSAGAGSLETAIATGQAGVDALTAKIESDTALKSQLIQDVTQHKTERDEARATLKESETMRTKEAAEFAKSSGEMKANLAAMDGAIAALKKGLSSALLQTGTADFLRNLVQHSPAVADNERDTLLSFLDASNGASAQGSDQIVGIVQQMKATMQGDLDEATSSEEQAKASYDTLTTTKTEEIAAASKAVESKTVRAGETSVKLTQAKSDLQNTEDALGKDTKFQAELQRTCSTKQAEWDARQKIRAQEIAAISETIEMLNSDDALDLFKKTMPSTVGSLLQVTTEQQAKANAISLIRKLLAHDKQHSVNLRMMLLALKSKSSSGQFPQVAKMIDGMIELLVKETEEDDKKKAYCTEELHTSASKEAALATAVHEVETSIAEKEDDHASLKAEIEDLEKGVQELDKMVAEATQQRKEEHEDYTEVMQSNSACVKLIGMAKNRMLKFYSPSQYVAPTKTIEASSPYGFVQVSRHAAHRISALTVGPAPEVPDGEYKKSGESSGVIAMMDQMIKDVEMDNKEAQHAEGTAQKDYTDAMADAAAKRKDDSKLLVVKEAAKASLAGDLASLREARASKREQASIAADQVNDLHRSCDTFLAQFDDKQKDRATELEGLKQSKALLGGGGAAPVSTAPSAPVAPEQAVTPVEA